MPAMPNFGGFSWRKKPAITSVKTGTNALSGAVYDRSSRLSASRFNCVATIKENAAPNIIKGSWLNASNISDIWGSMNGVSTRSVNVQLAQIYIEPLTLVAIFFRKNPEYDLPIAPSKA